MELFPIRNIVVTAPITLTGDTIGLDFDTDDFSLDGTTLRIALHDLTLDANLQVWLRGDDEAGGAPIDLGRAGNAWTYQAGAAQVDAGVIGKAFTFDGTGDYFDATSETGFPSGTDARTICFWMKSSASRAEAIYSQGTVGAGEAWEMQVRGDADGRHLIAVSGGNLQGTQPLNDGKWHHVAVTSDGVSIETGVLYFDGEIDTISGSGAENLQTVGGPVQIGGNSVFGNDNYTGLLDDIRVYDRELTAAEIKELYELGTLDAMTAFDTAYFTEYVASRAAYFNRTVTNGLEVAGNTSVSGTSLLTGAITAGSTMDLAGNLIMGSGAEIHLVDSDVAISRLTPGGAVLLVLHGKTGIVFSNDGSSDIANFDTNGDFIGKNDFYFIGAGSGLPYGSFWGNDIAFVSAGGSGAFFEISDANITVGQTNLTTFQNNKEIAVTKAGVYKVMWSMSVKATGANKHIVGGIGVDAGGAGALTIQNDGRNHSVSTGNAEFGLAGGALLDLSASSEVGLMATNETDGTNVTVEHVTLVIDMDGGT